LSTKVKELEKLNVQMVFPEHATGKGGASSTAVQVKQQSGASAVDRAAFEEEKLFIKH